MSGPYAHCQRLWRAADTTDHRVYAGDTRGPAQIHLVAEPDDRGNAVGYVAHYIPAGHATSTHHAWITPCGATVLDGVEPAGQWAPDELLDTLAHAQPLPQPHHVHGYAHDGVTTALCHTWQAADGGPLAEAHYVLAGHPEPALWRDADTGRHLNLHAWWAVASNGCITQLDRAIRNSTHRVEMRRRAGHYHYVLTRDTEPWTGITGPALYVLPGEDNHITLDQALRRRGTDIRDRFDPLRCD